MKTSMKSLALLMVLCMTVALLAGCGSKAETPAPAAPAAAPAEPAAEEPAEAPAEAPKYTFTFGNHQPVGSWLEVYCQDVAKRVAEKTDGQVELVVYSGAQLGTEQEASDGILLGTQEFTCIGADTYQAKAAGFGVQVLPFMSHSADELWHIFNETDFADKLNANLIPQGGRVLSWLPTGGRQMIFVDKEITSYKQIAGLNMRCPENAIFTGMFKALGAAPTPITWSDCYTALQTKVVDGMETPLSSMFDMNFADVTKYVLITNHMWGMQNIVVNENTWQTIPADLQEKIMEAIQECTVETYEENQKMEAQMVESLEEKGLVVHTLSEEEQVELPSVFDDMKAEWAKGLEGRQEIYDLYVQLSNEYLASHS